MNDPPPTVRPRRAYRRPELFILAPTDPRALRLRAELDRLDRELAERLDKKHPLP